MDSLTYIPKNKGEREKEKVPQVEPPAAENPQNICMGPCNSSRNGERTRSYAMGGKERERARLVRKKAEREKHQFQVFYCLSAEHIARRERRRPTVHVTMGWLIPNVAAVAVVVVVALSLFLRLPRAAGRPFRRMRPIFMQTPSSRRRPWDQDVSSPPKQQSPLPSKVGL